MIEWDRYLEAEWMDGGREFPLLDCFGFLRDAYRTGYGIEVTEQRYRDARAVETVGRLIAVESGRPEWVEVPIPAEGDVVLIREDCSYPTHIALARSPRLFYSMGVEGMHVIDLSHPVAARWMARRVAGYYRHRSRLC